MNNWMKRLISIVMVATLVIPSNGYAKASFVASSGKVVIGGLEHPHMQPTYYLMVHNRLESVY